MVTCSMRRTCKISGCGKVRKGHGLCDTHYMQIRRAGGEFAPITDIERFEESFEKTPGCWLWDKPQRKGYGTFMIAHQSMPSSRASWILYRGEIPDDLCVCHSCDNPQCVNPDHLFLGTYADNSADMVEKDRQAKGVQNGNSRLTESKVIEIRTLDANGAMSRRSIGRMFGVSGVTVKNIVDRKQWRHV
jgi:hypothetical protein